MENKKKIDDSVIKTLDIKIIRRLICNTDKGPLDLVIRKGENNYFLMLDSTPLDKEINDKLMGILFKPEITVLHPGQQLYNKTMAEVKAITISNETLKPTIKLAIEKIKKAKKERLTS